uniref:NADH-ubiquinone oxidoreductase chain 4 n=1 Tax=Staphylinidae sp. BMNH 1274665 TaxID=1796589 RepID=A0A126TG00_9COLE|nr:NADH dehydrogenase subunit 4 [Staphylinidae sp. BMNH 1274665]
MKFIFMMIFMIPLMFLYKKFWLNQYLYLMMSFIYLMNIKFSYSVENLSYGFMSDLLSYIMILLSLWICSLMLLASAKIYFYNNYYYLFLLMLLMLLISLVITFSTSNLFVLYLFFEMSLIPTLILIIGWGYQPERLQAGYYLLFYTLFGSMPMLMFIFYYDYLNYSINLFMLNSYLESILLFMMMNLVFLVKMPMYMVHLWLPKAHVEAPVSGSMILAGVMLKLGGYGLMRFLNMFIFINMKYNYIIIVISLLGGIMVSMMCLRQNDMKSLIAYSSVAHMGLVLSGIMTLNFWGFCGSLVMMLAHGLCSSGLFCLANVCYERLGSRSIYLNKGLLSLMPSMSLWWFLLCSSNMAAPPSLNLLGEIMLINSLVSWSYLLMYLLIFISFFSAAYSLYLFSFTQHGNFYHGIYYFLNGNLREYLLLLLHWLPLNLMILKSDLLVLWIYLNSL